jgi:hypothetical protein
MFILITISATTASLGRIVLALLLKLHYHKSCPLLEISDRSSARFFGGAGRVGVVDRVSEGVAPFTLSAVAWNLGFRSFRPYRALRNVSRRV